MDNFLIAMTTSPRSEPTIHRSVESLRSVGFHESLHVFAEPDSERPHDENTVMHQNDLKLGSFQNHYQAMHWAAFNLKRHQTLLLLEDDVTFRPSFYKLIHEGPETTGLIVGLAHEWTIKEHHPYLRDKRGWCQFDINYGLNNVHGGQCYVIHPRMFERIMQSKYLQQCLVRAGAGEDLYYTDNIIVTCAFPGPVWLHIPSLCQHIGSESYFFKPDDPNDPLRDRRGYLFECQESSSARASASSEILSSHLDSLKPTPQK